MKKIKVALFVFFIAGFVFAQEAKQDSSNYFVFDYIQKLTENDYTRLLDSLYKHGTTDYFTLRMSYLKTKDYSPYGSEYDDSLDAVVKYLDKKEYKNAIFKLNNIFKHEFPSMKAHLYAGFAYKMLNDTLNSNFHYKVLDELVKSLYVFADGKCPEKAHIVINVSEEYALMNYFGYSHKMQSLISSNGHSFDKMVFVNSETKEEIDKYFNVDIPMGKLSSKIR